MIKYATSIISGSLRNTIIFINKKLRKEQYEPTREHKKNTKGNQRRKNKQV